MTGDLFAAYEHARQPASERITDGAVWLRAFADTHAGALMQALDGVLAQAPLRHMQTPGGHTMSVATSSCGALGWVSDRHGYRYQRDDPLARQAWPQMPHLLQTLAAEAAALAGFAGFMPDSCLINRYAPGARMSLHQDRNERDMTQPIVSISLGLPATFLFGGAQRHDKALRLPLESGDVVVWGGPARLRFHGVETVKAGTHPLTGECRFNLTLRCAG